MRCREEYGALMVVAVGREAIRGEAAPVNYGLGEGMVG